MSGNEDRALGLLGVHDPEAKATHGGGTEGFVVHPCCRQLRKPQRRFLRVETGDGNVFGDSDAFGKKVLQKSVTRYGTRANPRIHSLPELGIDEIGP